MCVCSPRPRVNTCPNNCSGRGECRLGNSSSSGSGVPFCQCEDNWTGPACDAPYCLADCGAPDRGRCQNKSCICKAGWQGGPSFEGLFGLTGSSSSNLIGSSHDVATALHHNFLQKSDMQVCESATENLLTTPPWSRKGHYCCCQCWISFQMFCCHASFDGLVPSTVPEQCFSFFNTKKQQQHFFFLFSISIYQNVLLSLICGFSSQPFRLQNNLFLFYVDPPLWSKWSANCTTVSCPTNRSFSRVLPLSGESQSEAILIT